MCRSERSFNWASVVISMAVVTFFSLSGEGGATTSQESRAQTDDMFVDGSHFQPQKLAQVSDAERQSRELIGHKLLPEGARARSYAQKLVTACSGGVCGATIKVRIQRQSR